MSVVSRIAGIAVVLLVAAVLGVAGWLAVAPPELIRLGSAYAAKIICSNVFLAGRDAQAVLADDVQAPGHPLLKLMRVTVDEERRIVSTGLFGLFGQGRALYREGLGCTVMTDGLTADDLQPTGIDVAMAGAATDLPWPDGDDVPPMVDPKLAGLLADPEMAGPGMRAVVVIKDGRLVAERYGAGFGPETPLLGWSMTKTVNMAILGTVVAAGKLGLDAEHLLPAWAGDDRDAISIADLAGMQSGLAFNEDYGDVTDVTRMLFLERDMATFAAQQPQAAARGSVFNYSSGTAAILSRAWQDALGYPAAALAWPRKHLFEPIGMRSAVLEPDAAGTFVGSSYLYATGRDWARFGQLLLQDGQWKGVPVLPSAFVGWMHEPASASKGAYGRGQLWLDGPGGRPNAAFGLPADTYWAIGHDGQSMAIIPSAGMVVLRMGLTPSKLGYQPQPIVAALVNLLARP
jgi:CubicO group peptidase (beta-lactamase class C family)